MTQGLVRYQQTGDLYLVTFSCYQGSPYLGSTDTRDLFVRLLERMRQRYDFFVSGYVVMPEHVHLLVSEPRKASPRFIAAKVGWVVEVFRGEWAGAVAPSRDVPP